MGGDGGVQEWCVGSKLFDFVVGYIMFCCEILWDILEGNCLQERLVEKMWGVLIQVRRIRIKNVYL